MVQTHVTDETHCLAKAFAAIHGISIPHAYALLVPAGLKKLDKKLFMQAQKAEALSSSHAK